VRRRYAELSVELTCEVVHDLGEVCNGLPDGTGTELSFESTGRRKDELLTHSFGRRVGHFDRPVERDSFADKELGHRT
jgi:hypothetical protein